MLVVLLVPSCGGKGDPQIGKAATDFSIVGLDNTFVRLSDFQGKPVLLNFWAIRCSYCRDEMPYLQQVYDEYASQGLVVMGINDEESLGNVKPFIENAGYTFTILLDRDGSVAEKYGIYSLPATFFIDKNGIISAMSIGPFQSKADIEKYLKEIL
jgi:cytochrome c biogenesis protein CcmG, thiol:disulfide interchange protein DsbE